MGIIDKISGLNALFLFKKNITENVYSFSKAKEDYYVNKQYKKVVIYKGGHGIIENSFDFKINKPENFKSFYRCLNISDGNTNSNFPSLSDMIKCDMCNRFKSFGIWFNSTNNFINNVEEFYWSEGNVNSVDSAAKSNSKILKFKFNTNSNNIIEESLNNLTYTISVPGLYPISQYKYDSNVANIESEDFSSSIIVKYNILYIRYVIGFESGFEFEQEPTCTLTKCKSNYRSKILNIRGKIRNNNFYTYYEFDIKRLKHNDKITITWKLKK